jgi:hypothetical protein
MGLSSDISKKLPMGLRTTLTLSRVSAQGKLTMWVFWVDLPGWMC